MLIAIVLFLVLAYVAATWAARSGSEPHPTLMERWRDGPHVIAHQGGDELWPGNTRRAMDQAVALGADVLEMDVRLTRDDRLVVIHDATVDRTTHAVGAVADLDADELSTLDAGYRWTPDGGETFPYRGDTGGVPTLRDVFRDHPEASFVIDLKDDGPRGERAAKALCDLLQQEGRVQNVVVASFHASTLSAFRERCPAVATSATPSEVRTLVLLARVRLDGPIRPAYAVVQVPVRQGAIEVITPSLIRAANAKGVQVHAWTIDEEDEMRRLLDLGVHGLITDRPDRALEVLGRPVDEEFVREFVTP